MNTKTKRNQMTSIWSSAAYKMIAFSLNRNGIGFSNVPQSSAVEIYNASLAAKNVPAKTLKWIQDNLKDVRMRLKTACAAITGDKKLPPPAMAAGLQKPRGRGERPLWTHEEINKVIKALPKVKRLAPLSCYGNYREAHVLAAQQLVLPIERQLTQQELFKSSAMQKIRALTQVHAPARAQGKVSATTQALLDAAGRSTKPRLSGEKILAEAAKRAAGAAVEVFEQTLSASIIAVCREQARR